MAEHQLDTEQTPRGHRWFAVYWDWVGKHQPKALHEARKYVAGGATGRVLEVGCGNGSNFPYFTRAAAQIAAVDPDPYMVERAEKRAAEIDRPIEVRLAPCERLPFEDASFDTAVVTLVLCSVDDQAEGLSEIRRVLCPGGELRFLEHVRYRSPIGAFWQDAIEPIWGWFGAGCHPNRDTERAIREAGFDIREMSHPVLEPPLPPMVCTRPTIMGVAGAPVSAA